MQGCDELTIKVSPEFLADFKDAANAMALGSIHAFSEETGLYPQYVKEKVREGSMLKVTIKFGAEKPLKQI